MNPEDRRIPFPAEPVPDCPNRAKARRRQEAMLRTAGAAVMLFSDELRVVQASDTAARFFAHADRPLVGQPAQLLFAGTVDEDGLPLPHDQCPLTRCLRTGEAQGDRLIGLTGADGGRLWVRIGSAPMPADCAEPGEAVICTLIDMTAMRTGQHRMEHLARVDMLTGLANRATLDERLLRMVSDVAPGDRIGLLVMDLNGFKHVNDTLGHVAGDALLIEVARRFRRTLRTSDLLARRGGDEFVLVAGGDVGPGTVESIAQRLQASLRAPFMIEGQEVFVSVAIGAALFPDHAQAPIELFRLADAAMYQAKRGGPDAFVLHSSDAAQHGVNRIALQSQLHHAIEREEFLLHYQPRFDARTGRLGSVEALVRWLHPRRGLVPPGEFIPLAEETGLIVPLGDWVLRQACAQGAAWQQGGKLPIRISVNVSARQFSTRLFDTTIPRVVAETGFQLRFLELEITESVMLQRSDAATLQAVNRLREQGLRVLLDDFGTGYSSLSMLQRFPLDGIKLDRGFVQRLPDAADTRAITEAIVRMAQALGLDVVAEGVETNAQRDCLAALHCDELQGFLLAKPLSAGALSVLMDLHRG